MGAVQIPAFQGGWGPGACIARLHTHVGSSPSTWAQRKPRQHPSAQPLAPLPAGNIFRQRGRAKSAGQHPALPRQRAPLLSACGSPAPPQQPPCPPAQSRRDGCSGSGRALAHHSPPRSAFKPLCDHSTIRLLNALIDLYGICTSTLDIKLTQEDLNGGFAWLYPASSLHLLAIIKVLPIDKRSDRDSQDSLRERALFNEHKGERFPINLCSRSRFSPSCTWALAGQREVVAAKGDLSPLAGSKRHEEAIKRKNEVWGEEENIIYT